MADQFDVVVVGAGLAGTTAAIACARRGLQVALLERGQYPGSKNVQGGILYRHPLDTILPKFWDEAPLERQIIEQRVWITTKDGLVSAGHRHEAANDPPNAWSVLRAKFDRWYAKKAEEAGVVLANQTTAHDLLWDGPSVAGVKTADSSEGDLPAKITILAEGVTSILAEKAGLRRANLSMDRLALAVKEVVTLPASVIEDRFNVRAPFGATIELLGEFSKGTLGYGFIYTNTDSLSIGFGAVLADLVATNQNPNDLLEEMKAHPAVAPLLEGGELSEYSAHSIPEGGFKEVQHVHGAGVMVVGDSAALVNVFHREGSNLAIESARLAAETAVEAIERKDTSAEALAAYRRRLWQSFAIRDLEKYKNGPDFFQRNRQFLTLYPRLLNDSARELTTVDGASKREKQGLIIKRLRRERGLLGLAKDLWGAWRAVR